MRQRPDLTDLKKVDAALAAVQARKFHSASGGVLKAPCDRSEISDLERNIHSRGAWKKQRAS